MENIIDIVREGKLEELKSYIENDFNINIIDNMSGCNLLLISLSKENFEVSNFLIENGIDINFQDKKGQSALHYLAINYNNEVLKNLLEKRAKVNIIDIYGNQPLWTAVFNDKGFGRRLEMIELLLMNGAKKNHKNKSNKSPLDLAEMTKSQQVLDILNKY